VAVVRRFMPQVGWHCGDFLTRESQSSAPVAAAEEFAKLFPGGASAIRRRYASNLAPAFVICWHAST
jgi:hypothetical protein